MSASRWPQTRTASSEGSCQPLQSDPSDNNFFISQKAFKALELKLFGSYIPCCRALTPVTKNVYLAFKEVSGDPVKTVRVRVFKGGRKEIPSHSRESNTAAGR